MPHTYIRTRPGSIGTNSRFVRVSVSWILSISGGAQLRARRRAAGAAFLLELHAGETRPSIPDDAHCAHFRVPPRRAFFFDAPPATGISTLSLHGAPERRPS